MLECERTSRFMALAELSEQAYRVVRDSIQELLKTKENCDLCHAFRGKQGGRLLAVDDAVFQYEGNLLQRGDIVKRIAGDSDYIGSVAGFDSANFTLPAQ